MENGSMAG
jgi:hypothetical protein